MGWISLHFEARTWTGRRRLPHGRDERRPGLEHARDLGADLGDVGREHEHVGAHGRVEGAVGPGGEVLRVRRVELDAVREAEGLGALLADGLVRRREVRRHDAEVLRRARDGQARLAARRAEVEDGRAGGQAAPGDVGRDAVEHLLVAAHEALRELRERIRLQAERAPREQDGRRESRREEHCAMWEDCRNFFFRNCTSLLLKIDRSFGMGQPSKSTPMSP